jgi:hypothetical protein
MGVVWCAKKCQVSLLVSVCSYDTNLAALTQPRRRSRIECLTADHPGQFYGKSKIGHYDELFVLEAVVNGQVVKKVSVPTEPGIINYRDSRRRTLEP